MAYVPKIGVSFLSLSGKTASGLLRHPVLLQWHTHVHSWNGRPKDDDDDDAGERLEVYVLYTYMRVSRVVRKGCKQALEIYLRTTLSHVV
jgi:hypothetical protein